MKARIAVTVFVLATTTVHLRAQGPEPLSVLLGAGRDIASRADAALRQIDLKSLCEAENCDDAVSPPAISRGHLLELHRNATIRSVEMFREAQANFKQRPTLLTEYQWQRSARTMADSLESVLDQMGSPPGVAKCVERPGIVMRDQRTLDDWSDQLLPIWTDAETFATAAEDRMFFDLANLRCANR